MDAKKVLIYWWAVSGVLALIAQALWKLSPIAWEALTSRMTPVQWTICLVWVVLNAYSEGYVGFHQKFSPRVARRALELSERPTIFRVLLAAPYAMGLFAADRRTKIVGWVLTVLIFLVVIVVRLLEQPWRGIVDAGVVAGLLLGTFSLVLHSVRRWADRSAG